METNNDEEIKELIRKGYPHMIALAKDKVCPSEDTLAAFAEGKLKGKKEEQVIAHLAFCNDCLEMIKFLRQAPSTEEISVPLWLEETVRDLFPEKPKTWEIVVGHVKTALEVMKHTAEECWTLPGLEVIPAKKLRPAYAFEPSVYRNIYLPSEGEKSIRAEDRRGGLRDFEGSKEGDKLTLELPHPLALPPQPAVSTAKDNILKSLKKRISNGLVFIEHIGPYDVYLAIAKKKDKRPEIFEVEIEVYDRSGRFAEEIEVSFIQGRKTIEKSVTRKKVRISKRLSPKKYSIKLKHKGLYLGQALLDLREERPK